MKLLYCFIINQCWYASSTDCNTLSIPDTDAATLRHNVKFEWVLLSFFASHHIWYRQGVTLMSVLEIKVPCLLVHVCYRLTVKDQDVERLQRELEKALQQQVNILKVATTNVKNTLTLNDSAFTSQWSYNCLSLVFHSKLFQQLPAKNY